MLKNIINFLLNSMISKNVHKPIQTNSIYQKPKYNLPLMTMKTLKFSSINSCKKENFRNKNHRKKIMKAHS